MTIKTQNHHKKPESKYSRKKKKDAVSLTINEKAPLLPKKKGGEHSEFNGASFTGAVFNLSTTIIGAGIMALPAAIKVLGLAPGIAIILLVAVLSEASVSMLLMFSGNGKSDSYGGVMGDAFGNVGKAVLQICVVINNIGTLIVYMIIIGKQSKNTT